jgi:hypothetical protein
MVSRSHRRSCAKSIGLIMAFLVTWLAVMVLYGRLGGIG